MMSGSRWLPVVGWDGLYEVSDDGRVRSIQKRQGAKTGIMKTPPDNRGYAQISLTRDGVHSHFMVHRLVLEAFVGPRPEGMECRHLDGDRMNNRLSNLRWGTPSENNYDRVRHGTFTNVNLNKTHCKWGHEFTPENTEVVERGNRPGLMRRCKECRKRANREQAARRKAARAAKRSAR